MNNNDFLTIYKIDDHEIRYIVEFNNNTNIRIAIFNSNLYHIKKFIENVYKTKEEKNVSSDYPNDVFIGYYTQDTSYILEILYTINNGLTGYVYETDEDDNFNTKDEVNSIIMNEFINKFKEILKLEGII